MWVTSGFRILTVNCGPSLSDVSNPVVTACHGEGLGNCFVVRRGRHVERVRGLVQIMDDDCAGFEGHEANLSYSLFVSLSRHQLIAASSGQSGHPIYISKHPIRGCFVT